MRIKDLFNKRELKVEIADSPSAHQRGLMFRKSLDVNDGMLFKFSYPQNLRFWGLNTYIPLDIAFVSPDNIISEIKSISPLSSKIITSDHECNIAIEANYNYFLNNKINIGDKIEIKDNNCVVFTREIQ